MLLLYELSVWLHILAACAWVGGMVFLVVVVVPLLRKKELSAVASAFVQQSGERFRTLGWICLGVLILTGTVNMAFRGIHWADFFNGRFAQNPIARPLALKLLLVALVLTVSAIHDFWIGPRAARLWREAPEGEATLRARKRAASFGRLNGMLALVIVLLAVFVVRGGFP